jgi:hypothetical protein
MEGYDNELHFATITPDAPRHVTLHPRVTGNNSPTLPCLALFLVTYRFCCSAIQESKACVYTFSLDKTSSTCITPRSAETGVHFRNFNLYKPFEVLISSKEFLKIKILAHNVQTVSVLQR